MTRSIRRGALSIAAVATTLALAPTAQAAPGVCNQASPHWLGGGLVALDPPVNSPAARYTVDIGKLPGKGAGLFDAAVKSPSLTVCDGGDDDGGGGVSVMATDTDTTVDVGDAVVESTPATTPPLRSHRRDTTEAGAQRAPGLGRRLARQSSRCAVS